LSEVAVRVIEDGAIEQKHEAIKPNGPKETPYESLESSFVYFFCFGKK
jgi:hypothetical protein